MKASIHGAARRVSIAVLAVAIGAPAAGLAANLEDPAEQIVLDYSMIHGKLAVDDRTTTVRVFEDGTVLIHRPFWQLDAGDFTTRLTAEELRTLVDRVLAADLSSFQAETVEAACQQAEAERLERTGIEKTTSDDTWTRIRLRWTVEGVPSSLTDHQVSWRNLAWSAETYPQIAPLQRLQAAERSVRALLDREDLVPVEDGQ